MKINGIGIIKKEQAMSILTKEGRQAVQSGDITLDELGQICLIHFGNVINGYQTS